MNVTDINYKINRFVDGFARWLLMAMILASAGLLMKMWALPAGGLIFVIALIALALLFLVQTGLSFVYIVSSFRLALLGAFCSLGLVLGFMAVIFRYQIWPGWQVILFITLPMYFLSALLLVYFLINRRKFHTTHYKFLVKNLIVPFVFTMLLLLVSFVLNPEIFNETFNSRKLEKQQLEQPASESDAAEQIEI